MLIFGILSQPIGDTARRTAPLASLHWENSSERIENVNPATLFHTQPDGSAARGLLEWGERRAVMSVRVFSTFQSHFLLFSVTYKLVQCRALSLFFLCRPKKTPRQLADLGSCNLNTRRPTYSLTNAVKITQERRQSEQNSSTFSTKLCTEGSLNAQKLSALFEK